MFFFLDPSISLFSISELCHRYIEPVLVTYLSLSTNNLTLLFTHIICFSLISLCNIWNHKVDILYMYVYIIYIHVFNPYKNKYMASNIRILFEFLNCQWGMYIWEKAALVQGFLSLPGSQDSFAYLLRPTDPFPRNECMSAHTHNSVHHFKSSLSLGFKPSWLIWGLQNVNLSFPVRQITCKPSRRSPRLWRSSSKSLEHPLG